MEDWKEFVKMAIVGIVILGLVGVVFAFVSIGTKSANSSKEKLAQSVESLGDKEYDALNGTSVSGSQVSATMNQYAGKAFAVWVNTKKSGTFTNYCGEYSVTPSGVVDGTGFYKLDGEFTADTNEPSGVVQLTNFSASLTVTDNEYINMGSKFKSNLVKDINGTIIGVAFEQ